MSRVVISKKEALKSYFKVTTANEKNLKTIRAKDKTQVSIKEQKGGGHNSQTQ